jgi:frataxin-like iron-binding protein CyaY
MKKILKLLNKFNDKQTYPLHSICIFSDESGRIFDYKMDEIYSFRNLKQLKQYLKND